MNRTLPFDELLNRLDKVAALADLLQIATTSREHDLSSDTISTCAEEIFEQAHAIRLQLDQGMQAETAAAKNMHRPHEAQDGENPELHEQLLQAIITLQRHRKAISEDEKTARDYYREFSLEALIREHLRLSGEPDYKVAAV